jgi:hypothetical protein
MTAARLWGVLAAYWLAAVSAAALVRPPLAAWPPAVAAATGAITGAALYCAVARAPTRCPGVAIAAVLTASAVAEELVWRGAVLAWLHGRLGPVVALALSSGAFAWAHAHGRRLHAATGLWFGALYLATGGLVAPCCAHGIYNLAVAGAAR